MGIALPTVVSKGCRPHFATIFCEVAEGAAVEVTKAFLRRLTRYRLPGFLGLSSVSFFETRSTNCFGVANNCCWRSEKLICLQANHRRYVMTLPMTCLSVSFCVDWIYWWHPLHHSASHRWTLANVIPVLIFRLPSNHTQISRAVPTTKGSRWSNAGGELLLAYGYRGCERIVPVIHRLPSIELFISSRFQFRLWRCLKLIFNWAFI
jgi:hypothetical protein